MSDKELVVSILLQIDDALGKIASSAARVRSPEDFARLPFGMETLGSICVLFMAIGEALKNLDKMTSGALLSRYPGIDWKGVIGFRDIIAHNYFDIDAEQVFWICAHEVGPLSAVIERMIVEIRQSP